jgi:pterin-4a-carbinolamine dehydratase
MSDYFGKEKTTPSIDFLSGVVLQKSPIVPVSFTWERVSDPNRLMKVYEFGSHLEMSNFTQEILLFQEDVGHYGKLTIDFPKVIVEVYTHDVNDITELDTDYAKAADQIRQDVTYYSEEHDYEF